MYDVLNFFRAFSCREREWRVQSAFMDIAWIVPVPNVSSVVAWVNVRWGFLKDWVFIL